MRRKKWKEEKIIFPSVSGVEENIEDAHKQKKRHLSQLQSQEIPYISSEKNAFGLCPTCGEQSLFRKLEREKCELDIIRKGWYHKILRTCLACGWTITLLREWIPNLFEEDVMPSSGGYSEPKVQKRPRNDIGDCPKCKLRTLSINDYVTEEGNVNHSIAKCINCDYEKRF